MNSVKNITYALSHLFYPRLCEGCNKPLLQEEEVLCLNCNIYNLPRTAYHHIEENMTFMRFAGRVNIGKATSFAYFTENGLLQHLLHGLKYEGKKEIGRYLGKQFGHDLKQTKWGNDIDMIIPVPLHPDKEAKRGFNQATIIAEGLSEILQIPVETNLLIRKRFTESQTKKTREERLANMRDVFAVTNAEKLVDKHILLVDDVLTTGATLEACALTLLAAKDVHINIATIGVVS